MTKCPVLYSPVARLSTESFNGFVFMLRFNKIHLFSKTPLLDLSMYVHVTGTVSTHLKPIKDSFDLLVS